MLSFPNALASFQHFNTGILLRLTFFFVFPNFRTWHFEEGAQFWLHLAVVEANSTDPKFTLFMVFPIKG